MMRNVISRGFGRRFALAAGAALLLPLVGTVMVYAQSTPTLTASQEAQANQVAKETVSVNYVSGYMSVNSSTLAANGLSSSQINYVESTIQSYDATLPSSSSTPTMTALPSSVSPNDPIWITVANFTGQKVILYEGASNGWGIQHMYYRHNWGIGAGGTTAAEILVHQAQSHSIDTSSNNNGRELYNKWFISKNIPFFTYQVELQVVVQPGNATEGDNQFEDGSVVTGYPIAGDYTTETWHGVPNTSIVPWWIGTGQYTQTLN